MSMVNKPSARDAATQVVDRFLATRTTSAAPAADLHACACGVTPEAPAPPPAKAAAAASEPKPVAPEIKTVDFVSEDDARRARTHGKKIYVNRKTIITPAARDLDVDGTILVMTE
jgi:hypothetical protein